ncbi:MAG: diphosphomevalonate decarboxylase [Bdellovibrionia bacterium]
MIWTSEAPANIALIKYMGKTADNVPLNCSLSFTLEKFKTKVILEKIEGRSSDEWTRNQTMAESDQNRFLKHLSFLKEHFGLREKFRVSSVNDFPSHCGLASSASSFAALTRCAAMAASELQGRDLTDPFEVNRLSRRGSGSSCRSFFSPFAVWDADGARSIEIGSLQILHQVVVVDSSRKEVSSSEAHKRVLTSALWSGRPERAQARFEELVQSLKHNSWKTAFEIVWSEFWDMHALFETSRPGFGYMKPGSQEVLELVRALWNERGDGPLATMDAGPNVHLLYRADQRALASDFRAKALKRFEVLGEGER